MNKSGPVIVIEDDGDDQEFLRHIFEQLKYPNEVIFFEDGHDALEYLQKEKPSPFMIISDINMPRLGGFELRKKLKMDAELNHKCIPYLFFSTASSKAVVIDAYSTSVQGFFVKPPTLEQLHITIKVIMEYWSLCAAPNNF